MKAEMEVYIKVDEEGTTAAAYGSMVVTDGVCKSYKANVPHIAFVYDIFLERILFIVKDVGPTDN
ncbi:hypothetical protein PAEPH01_2574 [Pancytospora epiphaga]|nr:hypothetical protein PAEPH01_2574 [Pancytospora epiphaga]